MHKYKIILALAPVVLSSCGTLNEVAIPSDVPPTVAETGTTSSAPLDATQTASVEPAKITAQQIGPESFGKATVLHEYWPVIQKAAGMYESIRFGTSQTSWALSPDGRYIAVAGCDAEAGDALDSFSTTECEHTNLDTVSHAFLFIIDAKTGEVIATLPETGQILTIYHLAFTHDSRKLLYDAGDHTLKIWDIETAKVETTITDESFYAAGYDISYDDKWLALGFEGNVRIWDFSQKKFALDLPSYGFPVFSVDGQKLLVDEATSLAIYDTGTWQLISDQPKMSYDIKQFSALSSDLSLMAVCSTTLDDHPVKIWDLATASLLQTLETEVGKCRRIFFSPDEKYMLYFNNHGAGPLVWDVEGWKFYRDTQFNTNFVGAKDRFVDKIQFSQDNTLLLVGTFTRLTLYALPKAAAVTAESSAPTETAVVSAPPANQPAPPTLEPKAKSCNAVVTGSLKLNGLSCVPASNVIVVSIDQGLMEISLLGDEYSGVVIKIPAYIRKRLVPGKYVIGDARDYLDEWRMTAEFVYHDPVSKSIDSYASYAETGEVVFTEIGSTISGSFEFGAHNFSGQQINVKGSFENIPFVYFEGP